MLSRSQVPGSGQMGALWTHVAFKGLCLLFEEEKTNTLLLRTQFLPLVVWIFIFQIKTNAQW